jgi:hypothetical protein
MNLLKEAYSRQLTSWRPGSVLLPSGMAVCIKTLQCSDDCVLLAEIFGGNSTTYSTVYLDVRDAYVEAALQTTKVIYAATEQ